MDSKRLELARWATDLRHKGGTSQSIVDDYNAANGTDYTKGFICGLWRDLRDYENNAPVVLPSEKILHIEDWQGVHSKPAMGEYLDAQAKLETDNRYLISEHDNDNHFPYQDNDAQALRSKIRQRLQPDLIVVGSDAADFPTISRFEADRRIPMGTVLSRFREHWWAHVDRLRYDAPEAVLRWIDGNHDERAWTTIEADKNNANILADYHIKTIEAMKQVYWCGTGKDSLEVIVADALVITHGWKATRHTASGMLDEFDRQYSVMAGHSHRPDYYTTGTKYKVTSLIGGCGCELSPHYDRRKKRTKWQHGYSYAITDKLTETAHVEHIDFHHTADSIWCSFNGDILSIKKQAYSVSEAA